MASNDTIQPTSKCCNELVKVKHCKNIFGLNTIEYFYCSDCKRILYDNDLTPYQPTKLHHG